MATSKKKLKKVRTHEKACRVTRRIRGLEASLREKGLSVETDGPLSYWYEVLSSLKSDDLNFVSSYKARDGHLFAVGVFKEALNTVCLEKAAQLEQGGDVNG
jgi:hypothetical protein